MQNNYENLIENVVTERNTLLADFYGRVKNAISKLDTIKNAFKSSFDKLGVNYTLQLTETLAIAFNKGYDTCFTSCNGYHRHYNSETLQQYIDFGYYGVGIETVVTEIENVDLDFIEKKLNNDLLALISNYSNQTLAMEMTMNNDTEEEEDLEEEEEEDAE